MDDFDRFGPTRNPAPTSTPQQGMLANPAPFGLDWSNLQQHELAGAAVGAIVGVLIVRWIAGQRDTFI